MTNILADGPGYVPSVYGGVRDDAEVAYMGLRVAANAPEASDSPPGVLDRACGILQGALAILDLPLSLVGDTLTLPITIHATAPASAHDDKKEGQ
jgi:uncharacterized protein YceK